ncbi:MAG: D-aminoacylase [Burkholderiales bacterium]|nr:D-aminoacylase [Burkholderiales bacterium]
MLVDGSGAPARRADVGIAGGVVTFIGDAGAARATRVIEAGGLIVAPGFIDSHAHDDRAVLADPQLPAKLSQGVTTVINGNCGNSMAPYPVGAVPPLPLRPVEPQYQFPVFGAYLDRLAARPAAVNVASLVGHTSLRACHVKNLDLPATEDEVRAMRGAAAAALRAGALGLSSGTFYPPAAAATADEIIAVGADLARHGGVYATHMRDEGDRVLEAIDEAATIARALGVPLVVSHHKVMGAANFGRTVDTLAKLQLLAQAQKICLDCYPYTASSSLLRPERLAQSSDIIVTSSRTLPQAAGKTVSALAAEWGCSREEALARVMPGTGMYFMMDEADVRRVLAYGDTMVGSDGISADSYPHPRLWGAFTRVLGHYSRDQKLFSLETAVHKMSGLTARAFGLHGRGEIREGFAADVTVFDAAAVRDRSTYTAPMLPSGGIEHVIVNGVPAWAAGEPTGARAGQCLRRINRGDTA